MQIYPMSIGIILVVVGLPTANTMLPKFFYFYYFFIYIFLCYFSPYFHYILIFIISLLYHYLSLNLSIYCDNLSINNLPNATYL